MTHAPDIAAIAKGLTKAQREAIGRSRRTWPTEPHRCFGPGVTRKALRERGLAHGDFAYLTSLGLAVRAHIIANQTEGRG